MTAVLDRPVVDRRDPAATTAPARILMKGNEAMAEAAIQAGCDAYIGYPITPQAELLEWMARRMPELGRVFIQAESEVAAISMALGAAAAGGRVLVSTSSPGFSLMAEAMSYLAGSRLPIVLIDVMRGGPGLGSIGPAQADYLQATRGHGHGDYRVPVLAPSSIAEAVEIVPLAFELAERYRTPVIVLVDGVLGQAMEPISPRFRVPERTAEAWCLSGAAGRPPRVIKSLHLLPDDLEASDRELQATYRAITEREQRFALESADDREILVVAYGIAARVARTAAERALADGLRVGICRPITLWPFPAHALRVAARGARAVVVVELSAGQLLEDVRLALGDRVPIVHHGRMGGVVPTPAEVVAVCRRAAAASAPCLRGGDSDDEPDEPDPVGLIEAGAWAMRSRGGTR